jgi:hypothetical protein
MFGCACRTPSRVSGAVETINSTSQDSLKGGQEVRLLSQHFPKDEKVWMIRVHFPADDYMLRHLCATG